MEGLLDLDSIEVLVIVDNELDPISPSPSDNVHQEGGIKDIAMRTPRLLDDRGKSVEYDLPMSRICHAAHGLSLLITACRGGERHCILMDGGPEAAVLEQNATRLNAETGYVERIFLSHWHTDHSGGLLKALDMIYAGRTASHLDMGAVIVDLHPGRPDRRGVRLKDSSIITLEVGPTIADIKARGGEVDLQDSEHLVLHGMFLVSGEIPRLNDYENGIESGMSFDYREGTWKTDELICDERFLMCRLKGRGIVMFTGCSHAGVINASRHAVKLGGGLPLYAIIGGLHLANARSEQIERTMKDLRGLEVGILIAGHCTGWRAKFEVEKAMPGLLVPSFVGSTYKLT